MTYLIALAFLSGHTEELRGPDFAALCDQRAALVRIHGPVNWSTTLRIDPRWPGSREHYLGRCE